jgi:hypothetical protein
MFKISGNNYGLNYRVNPVFMRYAENYKEAENKCEKLERKIKNGNAEKIDFEKLKKAERDKNIAENALYNVPKIINGGDLDKKTAQKEANNIHKIDFLA